MDNLNTKQQTPHNYQYFDQYPQQSQQFAFNNQMSRPSAMPLNTNMQTQAGPINMAKRPPPNVQSRQQLALGSNVQQPGVMQSQQVLQPTSSSASYSMPDTVPIVSSPPETITLANAPDNDPIISSPAAGGPGPINFSPSEFANYLVSALVST
jgi:hypothetical protein